MEIIFDDSFRFLSNFQKQEDEIPTRISSLGAVITERNIRIASVSKEAQDEFNKWKAARPKDRIDILKRFLNNDDFTDAEKEWFQNRITASGSSTSTGGLGADSGDGQGQAISESDIVGEAGADVATVLKVRETVIERLRASGLSDSEINNILVLFLEKALIPLSQAVKILDSLIQDSIRARVDPVDLIEFYAYHYIDKRNSSSTRFIIDQAVKLQELNPSLNIFNILKNAAIGNQAEVGKVILIKDPDARLVVNNLIALSQSNLPTQEEAVVRNFQLSRDALLSYQEKLRVQKALFDMMKTEEMNRNLTSFIADTSAIFKMLLTTPLFRALRDTYYDLQASKILLNTYSSLIHDTQPLTPNVTPREEEVNPGGNPYPYPNNPQRIGSRFVPLKKNNLVIAQSQLPQVGTGAPSIFGPTTTGSPTNLTTTTSPITGQQSLTGVQDPKGTGSLGYESKPDPIVATNFMREVQAKLNEAFANVAQIFKDILKFIIKGVEEIIESIKSSVTNIFQVITEVFVKITKEITEFFTKNWNNIINFFKKSVSGSSSGDVITTMNSAKEKFVKLAQSQPQTSRGGFGKQKWGSAISAAVLLLVGALGYKPMLQAINALKSLNNVAEIINLVLPTVLGIKDVIIEFVYEWNPNAGNLAPNSSQYYDRFGRLTSEGRRRLYNNQQTRISLGITGREEMALARAEKQRSENMATVKTQLDILQRAMDQSVYLGGKTDVAPANIPSDLKDKINIFLKFCKSVQDANQAEYLILKKAIDRVSSKFDPMQKIQAQNLLSNIRNDISSLQGTIAEYSSSAIVLDHIQRKRKLQMTLGPTLKRMQALESLGISKAALITGKNGVLAQLSRIRHEEASALQKLRVEYREKIQLLDNPDLAQKEFAFPVDTKATKLPLPPLPPTAPTSA